MKNMKMYRFINLGMGMPNGGVKSEIRKWKFEL